MFEGLSERCSSTSFAFDQFLENREVEDATIGFGNSAPRFASIDDFVGGWNPV